MSTGILKYTYLFTSNRATLQLFVQQQGGAYGEVAAAAGGVIVPLMYKLPRDFSGGYELKWRILPSIVVCLTGSGACATCAHGLIGWVSLRRCYCSPYAEKAQQGVWPAWRFALALPATMSCM